MKDTQTCSTCRFWGPHSRTDGWGYCKRASWYTESPLIKVENPVSVDDNGLMCEELKRTTIIVSPDFGCVQYRANVLKTE